MMNFKILCMYELKKLCGKKIVWISLLICVITILISVFAPFIGGYYIDGKYMGSVYDMRMQDIEYSRKLSGRQINQGLIEETISAYRKIPLTSDKHYTYTDEYEKYARPYSNIFTFIRNASGTSTEELMTSWQPSEADMYEKRQALLTSIWTDLKLSKQEMDFWSKRERRIKTPYTYQEHSGYSTLITSYQTVGIFVLLLIAICLSGVFADEHTKKTDQIVLCTTSGRTMLYWAKLAAGVAFSVISTFMLFAILFVSAMCMYGADGFEAAFQFIYAQNSDPITCGQAVLIAYGIMLTASVIISIFVMTLSEMLRSSVATLSISTGLLIIPMLFSIPSRVRVLAQIFNWLPWCFLSPWNIFGQYTISILGRHFTGWQAVPIIYLAVSLIIAVAAKPVYQRFQVSGR